MNYTVSLQFYIGLYRWHTGRFMVQVKVGQGWRLTEPGDFRDQWPTDFVCVCVLKAFYKNISTRLALKRCWAYVNRQLSFHKGMSFHIISICSIYEWQVTLLANSQSDGAANEGEAWLRRIIIYCHPCWRYNNEHNICGHPAPPTTIREMSS